MEANASHQDAAPVTSWGSDTPAGTHIFTTGQARPQAQPFFQFVQGSFRTKGALQDPGAHPRNYQQLQSCYTLCSNAQPAVDVTQGPQPYVLPTAMVSGNHQVGTGHQAGYPAVMIQRADYDRIQDFLSQNQRLLSTEHFVRGAGVRQAPLYQASDTEHLEFNLLTDAECEEGLATLGGRSVEEVEASTTAIPESTGTHEQGKRQ